MKEDGGKQWELQQKVRKYNKEPIRAENYKNWYEQYTIGDPHQIRWHRRTDQRAQIQNSGNQPIRIFAL